MANLNKGGWGKKGQRQEVKLNAFEKPNSPNLIMIFCKTFFLFVANFRHEIKLCQHAYLGFQS
jgi:hypothetical protein